jgi:hypothetical protein
MKQIRHFIFSVVFIAASSAHGAVVVANFSGDNELAGTTTSGTTSVGINTILGSSRNFRALQFEHGSGTITQILLGLSNFNVGGSIITDPNSPDVNPRVRIFSDVSGVPQDQLAVLTLDRNVTLQADTPTTLTFDLTSALSLQAGDLFWVVVSRGNEVNSPSNSGAFRWNFASDSSAPAEENNSGFSYNKALVGSLSYSGSGPYPSIPSTWNDYTGTTPAIMIVVPEPSTLVLSVIGMLGLLRRRR